MTNVLASPRHIYSTLRVWLRRHVGRHSTETQKRPIRTDGAPAFRLTGIRCVKHRKRVFLPTVRRFQHRRKLYKKKLSRLRFHEAHDSSDATRAFHVFFSLKSLILLSTGRSSVTGARALASGALRMSEEGIEADGGSSDGASLAEARILVQGQVRH